jgi:tRNA pseudouridine38-40 synthase
MKIWSPNKTARYLIELAYKGSDFHGWQKQPNATSVQENLEKAIATILRQKIEITGSSRTDAGVHAAQQFAHFDCSEPIANLGRLIHSANKRLPKGIAIVDIYYVPNDSHSRFDAIYRTYQYRLLKHKSPFWEGLAYHFKGTLNIDIMNEACEILKQHTDFQSFSKYHTEVKTFNCTIETAVWTETEEMVFFNIKANRFLRGMVRTIVGTMMDIGQGRLTLAEFEQIILQKDRKYAGNSAPAEGLTLMEVGYPEGYY